MVGCPHPQANLGFLFQLPDNYRCHDINDIIDVNRRFSRQHSAFSYTKTGMWNCTTLLG